MSPGQPRVVPNLGPEIEPHSGYTRKQQTDSGIAFVPAPRRRTPTQGFRGGAKPIALLSLQKTAKTAGATDASSGTVCPVGVVCQAGVVDLTALNSTVPCNPVGVGGRTGRRCGPLRFPGSRSSRSSPR